uniref:Uncharacterized protein n=1 Tax=Rangifer tarandus platyrhynchus TaxID=3082113 RepID=A0ACB0E5S3_RANTA|nr:unnamed protein product [Rangifer tarandus platyrhynchus]
MRRSRGGLGGPWGGPLSPSEGDMAPARVASSRPPGRLLILGTSRDTEPLSQGSSLPPAATEDAPAPQEYAGAAGPPGASRLPSASLHGSRPLQQVGSEAREVGTLTQAACWASPALTFLSSFLLKQPRSLLGSEA